MMRAPFCQKRVLGIIFRPDECASGTNSGQRWIVGWRVRSVVGIGVSSIMPESGVSGIMPESMENKIETSFSITLLIRHPSIDPDEVTRELGLAPSKTWRVREQSATPKGGILESANKESVWTTVFDYSGETEFLARAAEIAERVRPHASFLHGLVATGGFTELIIRLPGDKWIASSIAPEQVAVIAASGFRLAIEIFPTW